TRRSVRRDRLLDRLMDGEDVIEAGDRKHAKDRPARTNESQGALMLLHALEASDERPQPCTVHEGHTLKIDDDLVTALVNGFDKALAQFGRGEHVDLSLDV